MPQLIKQLLIKTKRLSIDLWQFFIKSKIKLAMVAKENSFFKRFGENTLWIPNIFSVFLVIGTLSSAYFAYLSYKSQKLSSQVFEEIKEIKYKIEETNSDLKYSYVFTLYQNMEKSAGDWRRCKFLQQPDCDVLSLMFLYDAENAINAFSQFKTEIDAKNLSKIQQFMCVGLSITTTDGQNRGLFNSIKDHKEANIKDHIDDFIRNCPKYILEKESVFKIENNNH